MPHANRGSTDDPNAYCRISQTACETCSRDATERVDDVLLQDHGTTQCRSHFFKRNADQRGHRPATRYRTCGSRYCSIASATTLVQRRTHASMRKRTCANDSGSACPGGGRQEDLNIDMPQIPDSLMKTFLACNEASSTEQILCQIFKARRTACDRICQADIVPAR